MHLTLDLIIHIKQINYVSVATFPFSGFPLFWNKHHSYCKDGEIFIAS